MKNLSFLFFLLLFISCNNDDQITTPPLPEVEPIDQLPPVTMNGANTFGCLINGEAWIADNPSIIVGGGDFEVDVRYDEPDSFLVVRAQRDNSTQEDVFVFFAENIVEPGEYQLPYMESVLNDYKTYAYYALDTLSTRTLKINHLDFENKIISGEFNFTVIGQEFIFDTLVITEGRFDAMYRE